MDIEKYMTEEDMREIAIDEWLRICREACNGNAERIIGNIAHDVVSRMVEECLGDSAIDIIKSKAIESIHELSVFTVFRRADVWDRCDSPAYKALMDSVVSKKYLIDKKVELVINSLSKKDALDIIKSGKVTIS